MSSVQIESTVTGAGVVTIQAPASEASPILTLPAATTTIASTTGAETLTNKTLGPGLVMGASAITAGADTATTSGTSVVLATNIPSWARTVTVTLNGLSTSGTSPQLIQFGTDSTPTWVVTGYLSTTDNYSGTPGPVASSTVGFRMGSSIAAASTNTSIYTFMTMGSNKWVGQYNGILDTGTSMIFGGGAVTLGAALTAVRLTTTNGTDTFDLGSASVVYE
jgi:hypothetical protein